MSIPGPVSSGAGRRLAGAALAVAGITVLARLAGFARTAAYGKRVGSGCVGTIYGTANTVPNIVFDIVAGGMLSALVVPILAPVLASGDRRTADRLVSALLSWTVVILVPISALVAVCAGGLISLLGPANCSGGHALGVRMLLVFAPQIVFYGIGVVLGGVLTAGHRFLAPALAPLLSSLVVISAYLGYGAMVGAGRDAVGLPRTAELVLSVGTTAGVLALAGALVVPVLRTGVRVRPTLRFPVGVAATVRRAALAGAATLAAQEISTAVMIRLANGSATGTLVSVTTAQTVFLLPWAVLILPVATTAYPGLAAAWSEHRHDSFRRRTTGLLTVVLVAAALGTALLIALAQPAAVLVLDRRGRALGVFAPTVAAFALGLLGWSLVALLARMLYAAGKTTAAALAQIAGQFVVIVADIGLSAVNPGGHRAVVLALGNSLGVTVAAALLLVAARRTGVLSPLAGLVRPFAGATAAAIVAAGVGWLIGRRAAGSGVVASLATGTLGALATAAAFAAVLALIDRPTLTRVLVLLRARA